MRIQLYRRFIETEEGSPLFGEIMPYAWYDTPEKTHMALGPYFFMLDEFARELANAINAFTLNVRRIRTWTVLFPELQQEERHEAIHEFVEPLVTLTLLTPYMLRSRFIFSAAHLCHQLNLIREPEWHEGLLPDDKEIYFASLDLQGQHWKQYSKLKQRLEKIANKAFSKATSDFRHAFSHRFSARIGQGITSFAVREIDSKTGKVSYGFGGTDPLDPEVLVDLLREELDRTYSAFRAYQALIEEQLVYAVAVNEDMLADLQTG